MKHRRPLKITSRTSSITNSFVQAIIPSMPATEQELNEGLAVLGMTSGELSCVYCGVPATDWDHLRPLVRNRRPTGFIDDVRNRVPSCNRCNQSKSGADWRKWMEGNALGSPNRRGVPDINQRIQLLDAFERWGTVKPLPLADLAGAESWDAHWRHLDLIVEKMRESQKHAEYLRDAIRDAGFTCNYRARPLWRGKRKWPTRGPNDAIDTKRTSERTASGRYGLARTS